MRIRSGRIPAVTHWLCCTAAVCLAAPFATLMMSITPSLANCVGNGSSTLNCTGDLGAGANFTSPVQHLNVSGLTSDVNGATGARAISLIGGNASLNIDLGGYIVTATGPAAYVGGRAAIGAWGGGSVSADVHNGIIGTTGVYTHGLVGGGVQGSSIDFSGSISTTGVASRGIWGNSSQGGVTLRADSTITTQADYADAIKLEGTTSVVLTHVGSSTTQGENAEGFYLRATAGSIQADTRSTILTHGRSAGGIEAWARDDVTLFHRGRVTTHGDGAHAIWTNSDEASVSINSLAFVQTHGIRAFGVAAYGTGDTNVITRGPLITFGDRSMGVRTASGEGSANVTGRLNLITFGDAAQGVRATAAQDVNIDQRGRLRTIGAASHGIDAEADQNVDVFNLGWLYTRGDNSHGILANAVGGNVNVEQRGALDTFGSGSTALLATSQSGSASVAIVGRVRNMNTVGGNTIDASASGDAAVNIRGVVVSLADNATAVNVSAGTGDATLELDGTIRAYGANANGVVLQSGSGHLNLVSNREIRGGTGTGAAIVLSGGQNGNTILNSGSISAGSDFAVAGSDFADGIFNTGTILGRVDLGTGDDLIFNDSDGVFVVRDTSDFGAGDLDVFDNAGLVTVSGNQQFTNLEIFDNSQGGTISMQNGTQGDTFTMSSDFIGGGSVLLDAKADLADELVIAGVVSGVTMIDVNYTTGHGVIGAAGLTLVDVTAGTTDGDDFTLQNGPIQDGLLQYNLALVGGDRWALVGAPAAAASSLLSATAAGTSVGKTTGGAIDNYIAGFRARGQAHGFRNTSLQTSRFSHENRSGSLETTSGTWFKLMGNHTAQAPTSTTVQGFQGGLDIDLMTPPDGQSLRLVAGITYGASYFSADNLTSDNGDTPNATNAGLYVAFSDHAFDASLVAKYDHVQAAFSDTGVEAGSLDFNTINVRTGLGYTLPGLTGPWSARVSATMDYSTSQIENAAFANVPVSFGTGTELTGTAGIALTYTSQPNRDDSQYRIVLHADLSQDVLRDRSLRIADYEALTLKDKRQILHVGASLDWKWNGVTAGARVGYRKDLASGNDEETDAGLTTSANLKWKF